MRLRRVACAACVLGLVSALAVSGCGGEPKKGEPIREGLAVELDGVGYTVFITRQLNPRDTEDRAYYSGPEAPPRSALYGVFLQACNAAKGARETASDFRVVDTQGHEFEPVRLPKANLFAYRPRRLPPTGCIPERGSIPAESPAGGALLLFELPQTATENRPLELEIMGAFDALAGKRSTAQVELDI
jgi:hypothetical protein